jgi:hypothetical protein
MVHIHSYSPVTPIQYHLILSLPHTSAVEWLSQCLHVLCRVLLVIPASVSTYLQTAELGEVLPIIQFHWFSVYIPPGSSLCEVSPVIPA